MQDEEYRGVDERLLDDFQRELDAEKKANKAKMTKIGIGLVLGLLVAGGFALFSGFGSGTSGESVTPVADGGGGAPIVDDLVTPRGVGDDEALATLAGENQIEEDAAPPGSLMKEGVVTEPVLIDDPAKGKAPPEPEAFLIPPSTTGFFFGMYLMGALPEAGGEAYYAIQVKVFDDAEAAIAERDRFIEKGIDAWIALGRGERRRYTVDVGSFHSADVAARQSAPLRYHGYPNEVTLLGDGALFTLRVRSYSTKGEAISVANQIAGSGFPAAVHTTSEPITLQKVRVGHYATKEEAKKGAARLREQGIPSLEIVEVME